jgi:hypothetical protein
LKRVRDAICHVIGGKPLPRAAFGFVLPNRNLRGLFIDMQLHSAAR